jgi:kynurenine formamidase
MPRFVDLSAPIVPSPPETPDPLRTELVFHGHEAGAAAIEALLGVPPELLRDGEGWAVEEFTRLGTHNTTHVDAPWHYNSTIAGEKAATIDELPLEWFHAPGVTAEATRRLYELGVRVMGIDAWGWDAPLHLQAEAAKAKGEPGIFWAAHQCDLAYSQIERLANLAALPSSGFTVSCFPLRIVGGSAGPARVVAILDE